MNGWINVLLRTWFGRSTRVSLRVMCCGVLVIKLLRLSARALVSTIGYLPQSQDITGRNILNQPNPTKYFQPNPTKASYKITRPRVECYWTNCTIVEWLYVPPTDRPKSVCNRCVIELFCGVFYTPVFRRDVLWYGDVRPSVRPSGSPSVHPSVRPTVRPSVTVFRTFLLHALTY